MSARAGFGMAGGDRSSSTARLLLPPGLRFCPTDGELVAHYLARKAADAGFASAAIRDVDVYSADHGTSCHREAADGAEEEEEERCGYFFCTRSFRCPSGLRTNRATAAGYWKSTGKDEAVLHHDGGGGGGRPVGVKKTLVFYRGRAPRGEKTSWVMHEYRLLHGGGAAVSSSSPSTSLVAGGARSEWVICRVFFWKAPSGNNNNGTEQHLPPPDEHLLSSPAPAVSVDGPGHESCSFSGANESMAPTDQFNIGDDHMIFHGHEEELLMNYYSAFDLPELLDYESFSMDR